MQPGHRHLADGVQVLDAGAPAFVDDHAAAAIVRGRHHRDGHGAHVDPQLHAAGVDGGEALDQEVARQVGHVQHREVVAVALQLGVDGAGHDVARGQVLHLVIAVHERGAVAQAQDAALAAQGLADQERLRRRVVKARRVELEELHVRHARPDPVRHGHAVAGRHVGVGRVQVDLAGAAGGQHHGARDGGLHLAGVLIQQVRAEDGVGPAVLGGGQQIDGHVLGQQRDAVGAFGHPLQQRLLDRPAGHVLDVDDPARGVAALASQLEVSLLVAVEGDAQLVGQAQDVLRALAHAALDGGAAAQAVAHPQRVGDVRLHLVGRIQHAGDTALGPAGVGIARGALGGDHHPAVLGGAQGEVQASQARADDQVVRFQHR